MVEVGDKVIYKFSNICGTVEDAWLEPDTFKLRVELLSQDGPVYHFYEDELIVIKKGG